MATLQQVRDALRFVSEMGVTPAELVAEAMAVSAPVDALRRLYPT